MIPLSELFAVFRWWLALFGISALATPLSWRLLTVLPDRGYAFARLIGLLIVSYFFWILVSFGFLGNNLGGILFACFILALLSLWAVQGQRAVFWEWVQANKRYFLSVELIFGLFFVVWVFVRAQNPIISATEKPMEFAFLNSVSRSPTYPPLDPWLSGFAISYYYFGYVMSSVIARLAFVAEPIAFNLTIAWLVAGTGASAFGLVYNLSLADAGISPATKRRGMIFGLLAALALPIAGNQEILFEVLHGNGVGSDSFWANLDLDEISGPANNSPRYEGGGWWWWRSSRVISEYDFAGNRGDVAGSPVIAPIAEFPSFSFVLGDMHPHVLALPFAILSIGVALAWWLTNADRMDENWRISIKKPLFWLTVLLLGGLSFLNTWDVLIYLFVIVGAILLGEWRRAGNWHSGLLGYGVKWALMLGVSAILLYLPFYIGFRSQAGAPFLLPFTFRPTRLTHFLIIFAMPLWTISLFLLTQGVKSRFQNWKAGIVTAVALLLGLHLLMLLFGWLVAASPDGVGRIAGLADSLGVGLPAFTDETAFARLAWALSAVIRVAPALITHRLPFMGQTLLLSTFIALVVMLANSYLGGRGQGAVDSLQSPTIPFFLLLILTGTLLTLGPEFLFLRDNFGQRINTVFKFYYQAWVLFGVSALLCFDYLLRREKIIGKLVGAGYLSMLAIALLFPFYGVQSRAKEFGGEATLNGMAHIQAFTPDEYSAIQWVRENVPASSVILEATGGQYSDYARVSANSGVPTLLGWLGHEAQWRGPTDPEPGRRAPLINQIYTSESWHESKRLLDEFGVDYIYVGNKEITDFGTDFSKFADNLEVAYANNSVVIYRWQGAQIVGEIR